ncbi:MAG: acylneuraminate cytidylyltransferase family protein [Peptococcaceae bacterium]|nr:acylneuraminate cytidylyltransferase family protein [Peptococcaceae bacterium]
MIDGKTVLAVIPARGGSKGVPRKNLRDLGGKPLLAWTIEAAKQSQYIDRLILSSDDAEIIALAQRLGCEIPFVRPAELARDDTPGIAPVLHAITAVPGYDYVVLLQPTSPLRSVDDIDGCIAKCVGGSHPVCVSITEVAENPYWMYTQNTDDRLVQLLKQEQVGARRQDLPEVYRLNGAVYVAHCECLAQWKSFVNEATAGFVMPQERSCDIDSEFDLFMADNLVQWVKHG